MTVEAMEKHEKDGWKERDEERKDPPFSSIFLSLSFEELLSTVHWEILQADAVITGPKERGRVNRKRYLYKNP